MATPMTADQWLKALRAEGVTDIVEMPGWRTHNRNHKGPWGPVHATMVHHTAGEGPGMPRVVYDGVAGLPGPLCHDFLARSGRLYLVGHGRANHAGTVARNAYNAVLNESSTHPYPDASEPIDGNAVSYGLEVENSGAVGRAWPVKQYDVAVRVQAARCRFHGWSADSVWAHKEATRRKPVDPRIDMNRFRADVAERLRHPASWSPGSTTPTTPAPQEDDMPLTTDDVKKVADAVFTKLVKTDGVFAAPKDAADYATNKYWAFQTHVQAQTEAVRQVRAQMAALTETNKRLVDTVAQLAAGLGDLDPAAIVAELTQAIESIDIRLDVPDSA